MRRLTLIALLLLAAAAQAQPGFWMTHDPGDPMWGRVYAVSQDGSVAVGYSSGFDKVPGFSWTAATGRDDFGLERGIPTLSWAKAVSSDGGTIVGAMGESDDKTYEWIYQAYRRVGNGPLQDLGKLAKWSRARATGVSGDGQIVVGTCHGSNYWQDIYGEPFRWTAQTGMIGLGHLNPDGDYTQAMGVSRDGTTIVGSSESYHQYFHFEEAYRWTAQTGMVELPPLPGIPDNYYGAEAVNADGSVIVGWAHGEGPNENYPVRWVNGAIEALGTFGPKGGGRMLAVDDSGNVSAGEYYLSGKYTATVWTPGTGLMFLQDYLALFGIHPPEGVSPLSHTLCVSGDGLTFGGYAQVNNSRGFVATIPAPCDADCDQSGQLDIDDFICFQTLFGLGDALADCDKSGELDFDDFTCFMTKFAAGCP